MISWSADILLSLAFPQPCHVCRSKIRNSKLGIACHACWSSTRFFNIEDTLCLKCGLPLDSGLKNTVAQCGVCSLHSYDRASACGVYENALSATVLNLKKVPVMPNFLRARIAEALTRPHFPSADIIIPVPLSTNREVERGFNQAELIAKVVGETTRSPIDNHSLIRIHHTPMHRAGMDRKAREATVKRAFEVIRPKLIDGRSVLLVDDILTSGATASACAAALKKNGVAEVNLFTLARAVTTY